MEDVFYIVIMIIVLIFAARASLRSPSGRKRNLFPLYRRQHPYLKTACYRLFGEKYDKTTDSYTICGKINRSTEKSWHFTVDDPLLGGIKLKAKWLPKKVVTILHYGPPTTVKIPRWLFENRYEKPMCGESDIDPADACEACGELASEKNPVKKIDSGQYICHNCRLDMKKS